MNTHLSASTIDVLVVGRDAETYTPVGRFVGARGPYTDPRRASVDEVRSETTSGQTRLAVLGLRRGTANPLAQEWISERLDDRLTASRL
jgi:hypothetical protein